MLQISLLAEHIMDAGHYFVPLIVISIPVQKTQQIQNIIYLTSRLSSSLTSSNKGQYLIFMTFQLWEIIAVLRFVFIISCHCCHTWDFQEEVWTSWCWLYCSLKICFRVWGRRCGETSVYSAQKAGCDPEIKLLHFHYNMLKIDEDICMYLP